MSPSPLSVQLYSIREALAEDLPGALARVRAIGFELVEAYDFATWPGLGDAIAAAGLAVPTAHNLVLGRDQEQIFRTAAEIGVATVIDPYVPEDRWTTEEEVAAVAAEFRAAAAVAREHGVALAYHNHAHEIRARIGGRTALEVFAEHVGDEVAIELDTYWVAVGGIDPVALLNTLGDRVTAIHVKDGPATDAEIDQVAVGSGSLPIAEILAAAPNALHVVEVDDSRSDRFQVIADSYAFLTEEVSA